MSFVLDALKVSEQRRSRFSRRIYAHPPRTRRRGGRGGWLAALGALAAVALVALVWLLATPVPGPDAGSVPAAGGITAAAPAEKPADDDSGTFAPRAPIAEDRAILAPPEPAVAAAATVTRPEGTGAGTPSPGAGSESLARESEMAGGAVLAAPPPDWPALSLQMLFFSEEESRSFVQVNGKTYRQGERLPAGPEILRITGDGVTLAYRGQQALLGVER